MVGHTSVQADSVIEKELRAHLDSQTSRKMSDTGPYLCIWECKAHSKWHTSSNKAILPNSDTRYETMGPFAFKAPNQISKRRNSNLYNTIQWNNWSVVKGTCCNWRGCVFRWQHPLNCSQPSVTWILRIHIVYKSVQNLIAFSNGLTYLMFL